MIGLDTNVLIRYLTQDDEAQSAIATSLIEDSLTTQEPGFVSVVTLVEIVWVLEGCYNCTKDKTLEILERLLRVRQLTIQDSEVVWQAVRLFKTSKADFADCLIERIAGANQCEHTVTFDKMAARTTGMRLLST